VVRRPSQRHDVAVVVASSAFQVRPSRPGSVKLLL
jgi:hypothetical protein